MDKTPLTKDGEKKLQEELKNLKENNKILKISQTEATEKINKLLIKIEKIIGIK